MLCFLTIRDILIKPSTDGLKFRVLNAYNIWKEYNAVRQFKVSSKGIKYNNFLKYLYVLERMSLIQRVNPAKNQKNMVIVELHTGENHPSGYIPENWEKQYYQANRDKANDLLWLNPYQAYYRSIGSEHINRIQNHRMTTDEQVILDHFTDIDNLYSGLPPEISPELQKKITRRRNAQIRKFSVTKADDRVTLKVSPELKALLDKKRGEKTVNGFLMELLAR